MIKIVFCLRRKQNLTPEEFRRYWLDQHAELVRRYAPALRLRRYTQSHTITDPRIAAIIEARGSDIEPYDGVAELWWDSIEEITEAVATKEGMDAGHHLLRDEQTFIDQANSSIFYTEEYVIFDRP
jgi:uncharacterized protein (TIGR02118 family)